MHCFLELFVVLVLGSVAMHVSDPGVASSLESLRIDGNLSFHDVSLAARDFGNRYRLLPSAVLYPGSVSDVAATVRHVFRMGSGSKLTVAARGHGHSLQGQAQADGGIVVRMENLRGCETKVHEGEQPYVDASGGALWVNVLLECLKHGLAPKSWTDYLHLTIGGTLSNAGISGQAFRHGPQISNVHQLEIVTGKGELLNCSAEENADLFYAALGGLGQFGIITRARIALEPAPKMVKWIRVLYSDFASFTEDQEMLISLKETFHYIEGFVIITGQDFSTIGDHRSTHRTLFKPVKLLHTTSPPMHVRIGSSPQKSSPPPPPLWLQQVEALLSKLSFTEDQEMLISLKETFHYIEGFVIINRTGLLNNWRSSFNPQNPVQASEFDSDGRILFCLEMTKNFDQDNAEIVNQVKLLHTTSPPMHVRIGSSPQKSSPPPPLWLQQVEALLSS
ncbi:hypothetical protein C4D60_Mb03t08530 [Musa balbisiana]|uniref:cytokinin dehydrogenase n=1 Tax=Musa balbisiana TaxID=52838 RepID=A0A4S8J8H0_MUSBA|nr:hypothetical protein C4D60_Mb03t08530 [Musa balbisiana]